MAEERAADQIEATSRAETANVSTSDSTLNTTLSSYVSDPTARDRLFAELDRRGDTSLLTGRNFSFDRLNIDTQSTPIGRWWAEGQNRDPRSLSTTPGANNNEVLTRAELDTVKADPNRSNVDRLRAEFMIRHWDRITGFTPGAGRTRPTEVSRAQMLDYISRTGANAVPFRGNLDTANINKAVDLVGQIARGNITTTNQGELSRILESPRFNLRTATSANMAEVRANREALMARLTQNRTDGPIIQQALTSEAASSNLSIPHLTSLERGRTRDGAVIPSPDPLKSLAASLAIRNFDNIANSGTTFGRTLENVPLVGGANIGRANFDAYAIRLGDRGLAPNEVTNNEVLTNRGTRIISGEDWQYTPQDLGNMTPGAPNVGRDVAAVIRDHYLNAAPDRRNPALLNSMLTSRGLPPLSAILADSGQPGGLQRGVFAHLDREGLLGRFIGDGLNQQTYFQAPGLRHVEDALRSTFGAIFGSDRAQVWGSGFNRQELLNGVNNTRLPELQRLQMRAGFHHMRGIENTDGLDSNVGWVWNPQRINNTEIRNISEQTGPFATTTGPEVTPPARFAAQAMADLAENPGNTNADTRFRVMAANMINNPTEVASFLSNNINQATIAKIASGEQMFNALKSPNGRITADHLQRVANNPAAAAHVRLTAHAMLNNVDLRTMAMSNYGGGVGIGIDRARLQGLSQRPPEGYGSFVTGPYQPYQGLVSTDVTGMTQAVADGRIPEDQSALAIRDLIRTNARWNANHTEATAQITYQRDGQLYVGNINLRRMPGDSHGYFMSMYESRAQLDASGRAVAVGSPNLAMRANLRFDRSMPVSNPANIPTIERQRSDATQQEVPFRAPRWQQNPLVPPTVTGLNGEVIPGVGVPYAGYNPYVGYNAYTGLPVGDNTVPYGTTRYDPDPRFQTGAVTDANLSGPPEAQLQAIAAMYTAGSLPATGAKFRLADGREATLSVHPYPGRGGAKNLGITLSVGGRPILTGFMDGVSTSNPGTLRRGHRVNGTWSITGRIS